MRDLPKSTPVENLPEEVKRACYELIAQALRENSAVLNITLKDMKHGDAPIPDFEISIRRLDL